MPLYYFHLQDRGSRLQDEQGVTLPDAEAAFYQAIRSARELIRGNLEIGTKWQNQSVEIEDEQGLPLFQVPLTEVAELALREA